MAAPAQKIAELRALLLRANAMLDELAAPELTYVDQDSAEILERFKISKRSYLENARANAFPNEKLGRQIRTTTAALEAWIASKRRTATLTTDPAADAIGAAIDLAAERIARRAGGRR